MTPIKLIAQIISIIAMCIALLSFQQKKQSRILVMQFCSGTLFTVHFFLLGAWTGCLLNLVGIFRAAVFANRSKKWASHIAWPILFCLLFAGIYVLNFTLLGLTPTLPNLLIELLPTLGMFATTISFRMEKASQVRAFSLISSPLWFTYNAINLSIGGMLTELFTLISILVGILRLDIKKKK
ncbi:MAG: YgjV family protein [Clostridia bacterium]|nr:YgjV family protein [Clostridia bacterium]